MAKNHEKVMITKTFFLILFLNDNYDDDKMLGNIYKGIANGNSWLLITPSLAFSMCSDNSCTSWRNFLKLKIYFCSENLLDGAQQIVTWGKSRKKKVVLDLLKLSTQTSTHTQELFSTDWPLQNLHSLSSATQGSFWRKYIPDAEYSLLSKNLVWEK